MGRRLPAFVAACVVFIMCLTALGASASSVDDTQKLQALSIQATDVDAAVAKSAIGQLRSAGPAGLAALIDANAEIVQKHRTGMISGGDDPQWHRVADAIDAVAAQKDAWASGLYWYTDLEAAKKAARESGKPILSLRLLGTLDTEFSCANSRFFRTVLYANAEVSHTLSDRFILHWKSVRPVPKVTIDFGDGRVVERTITGNSIHYVLDSEGRVIDGIPGLYGPKAFLRQINDAAEAVRIANKGPGAADVALRNWHAAKCDELLDRWKNDLQRVGARTSVVPAQITIPPLLLTLTSVARQSLSIAAVPNATTSVATERIVAITASSITDGTVLVNGEPISAIITRPIPTAAVPPTALQAAATVTSKTGLERPLAAALSLAAADSPGRPSVITIAPEASGRVPVLDVKVLEVISADEAWEKIAALHAEDSRLDETSRVVMAAKNPAALQAGRRAVSKTYVENPLVAIVQNFERSISEDTVRNEYLFHRQIHAWLAAGKLPDGRSALDVDALNERVYADLFLTPSSDPWLGLLPSNTYSALPNDGLCKAK